MSALVLCSLTVIVTLLWSGIAKALNSHSTAQAIINLKLDHFIPVRLASLLVPWGEIILALGLLLVPGLFGSIFGVLTLVLFAFYWGVILRAIIAGNTATCNCFGSHSNAPVSFFTLFRNTGLLLAAVGAFASTLLNAKSALGVLFSLDAEGMLWTFGAAIIALVLWAIYKGDKVETNNTSATNAPVTSSIYMGSRSLKSSQAAELDEGYVYDDDDMDENSLPANEDQQLEDDDDDYLRTPIPHAELQTAEGFTYSLRQLAKSKARVLLFVSPTCYPCRAVIEHIVQWQQDLPMLAINPVVSSESSLDELDLPENIEVFVDRGFTTAAKNFGGGTPTAVALGMDGLLAGGPVRGGDNVLEFMEDIMTEMGVTNSPDHK